MVTHQRVRRAHCIGQHEPNEPNVHAARHDGRDGQERGAQDDERADALEADAYPAVDGEFGEIAHLIPVDALRVLGSEDGLVTVGANCGQALEGVREPGKDGRSGGGIQAVEITRGCEVVAGESVSEVGKG